MKNKNAFYTSIALMAGVLLFLNLLSDHFFLRFDMTKEKQYTMSKATKDILSGLEEPVTVKAYFSENLPPDIARTRKDFKEMLIEYANLSRGNVVYEFINPSENEEKERDAMQNGIQPVMINVREKDQMKQQKAFLGAVVQKGEQKEAIPFMQPGTAMEYALSTSIKKISVKEKPSVAFIQGHGEPPMEQLSQVGSALNILYQVDPLTLSDTSSIPEKYKTLAIVAPKDTFPPSHLAQLDAFLARGGRMLVAMNRVKGDFSTASGSVISTGLESWLKAKGLEIDDSFVIDARCGSVTVQQQQGAFRFNTPVAFPYLPIIQKFSAHPITKGLEAVMFQFASPIRFTGKGDSSLVFTTIATTSDKSGLAKAPLFFDISKHWAERDFTIPLIPVAGVLEGKISGGSKSKIVIISDGDFAVNGERGQAQQLQPDNVSLMANSIDWLSDDTGLIELRTKGVTSRPIDQIEDGTKSMLKYINFLLPILLVIGYGVIRMQVKRNLRVRRMEENYA